MTNWLCIGGQLDGMVGTTEELLENLPELRTEYTSFNRASGSGFYGKWSKGRVHRDGRPMSPTAIYVHNSKFT